MALLGLENIVAKYGEIIALKNINLFVNEGEIVTLIGANGAGKTTTMKTISGLMKHSEGKIEFLNNRIDDIPGYKRVKLGIVHVPEGRDIFSPLTVEENLLMGAYLLKSKKEFQENIEKVFQLLPMLKERRNQQAGTLSGGEQQMLAIGRSLMIQPIFLMLDEPSLGLAPMMVKTIFDVIVNLHQNSGTTILLVEQNAKMALTVANRGYVLETGELVLDGNSDDLLYDERVRKAYLGA
jgi:branched-chain amino acid transport system ATP-binding protein